MTLSIVNKITLECDSCHERRIYQDISKVDVIRNAIEHGWHMGYEFGPNIETVDLLRIFIDRPLPDYCEKCWVDNIKNTAQQVQSDKQRAEKFCKPNMTNIIKNMGEKRAKEIERNFLNIREDEKSNGD